MLVVWDYLPLILKGMLLTVEVALLSLLIAVALGILGALAKLSRSRVARAVAGVYSTLIRGIPDLVLMTVIFFGGQVLVNRIGELFGWEYIDVNPFTAGVLTIGFIFGAYMTETFRGGILAVPRGEIEAGFAFGMTPLQVFVRITFPAMMRHALPGFGNNWLVLAKTTALVSVIGLHDMVYNAAVAGGSTRQPFTFYLVVAALFLLITAVSDAGLRRLNKIFSAGVRRA
ncbi:MAG: ABC transporter permease [Gammaproteobacteria bacterium]|nr:ABC transporter permease [Gammaproteobacteria bacterium]MDD9800189.1 ABC transporter permease [Gammaproteobacteria bacterium]MDD9852110.1 ABC transporter permease [Gammaproteobacteria bacterium]MDD9870537.1 ABC transporter permease [Gammaproteobacteria bacterium]